MPKATDKKKNKNDSSLSEKSMSNPLLPRSSSQISVSIRDGKKRKLPSAVEEISVSKQLREKKENLKRIYNKKEESRVCGNGKPMPSLAELEMMYQDSDDDTIELNTPQNYVERCKTPAQMVSTNEINLISPKTLKELSCKVVSLISHMTESNILMNTQMDPMYNTQIDPVYYKRRRKVPDMAGTENKSQIINTNTTYGVKRTLRLSSDDDNICPKKRLHFNNKVGPSSDVNDVTYAVQETDDSTVRNELSTDSDETIPYDYNAKSPLCIFRSFSPLPSTSKDDETIFKNEIRLQNSLQNDDSDVEAIEIPCETIIVEDMEFTEKEKSSIFSYPIHDVDADNDLDIIEYFPVPQQEPVVILDNYTMDFNTQNNIPEQCEIIDVDNIIEENKSLIKKFRKSGRESSVTLVSPNSISNVSKINKIPHEQNNNDLKEHNAHAIKDISSSGFIQNIIGFFQSNVQSLTSSWSMKNNTDQMTDQNTMPNESTLDDSVILVSSTPPCNQTGTNKTHNSNSSVIIIDCEDLPQNDNTCQKDKQKSKAKKKDSVTTNQPPSFENPTTQPARNIGESFENPTTQPARNIGECPICMDNLSDKSIASTICGHLFCMKCIKTAVKSSKKCPTCRKVLRGAGYHQIFL